MAPVQFGNYQILRKIGAGGMAQVFEAQRLGLEGFSRRVALKCILPEMTRDHRFVEMFVNEANLGSKLHHPNIVEIQDFNKVNEIYYIAMEFVEGVDLADVISRFRDTEREFPPGLAIDIMLETLDGLGYAHDATAEDGSSMHIIHRDIKPSNLLLTRRGNVKIADFGIAKAATNAYQTRTSEVTKGSLAYMAPEQITGETPVSAASDLFSLGAVLFEMLSLRALFDGETMPSIMFKVATVEIGRDLTELQVTFPQFIPILERALARDVRDRYKSAAEMADDIRPLRSQFPPGPSIHDLVVELQTHHPVQEESEWIGEQTAAILGFTSGTFSTSAPNLADFSRSQPGLPLSPGSTSDLHAQGAPAYQQISSPSLPTVPLQDSQPSLAITPLQATPPRSRLPLAGAIATLLVIAASTVAFLAGAFSGPATMAVTSVPLGAQILLDGQLVSSVVNGQALPRLTPARIELPSGNEALVTLQLDGYEPFSARINYDRGQSLELNPVLTAIPSVGSLEVTSVPPGAVIEINGREVPGRTPTVIQDLEAGRRLSIRLHQKGFTPASGEVEIRRGARASFDATLTPEPVAVVQTPVPPPASAPARDTSKSPGRTSGTSAPAPEESSGPPGSLVVSSVPPDCVVYVDGRKRGNAPVSLQLSPGKHRVKLEQFDGTVAKEFTVEVKSNEEITRVWDLDSRQFISE